MSHLDGRSSADPVNPDVDTYCWHHQGWECAPEGSVRDARTVTRGRAAAFFATEVAYGHLPGVRVWKRYVRPLTRMDVWEEHARERWENHHDLEYDQGPATPPDDWDPDWEADPVWEFVHRDHPDAIPVWICGEKDSPPPPNPLRKAETNA